MACKYIHQGDTYTQEQLRVIYNNKFNESLKEGFLKDFNIDVQEYDDIRAALGYDSDTMVDMVAKFIAVTKGAPLDKSVAYVAYKMLGKKNKKVIGDLKYNIYNWDKYEERFNSHIAAIQAENGFIEDIDSWRNLVRDRVIVDFLGEVIIEQYNDPKKFELLERTYSKKDIQGFKIEGWLKENVHWVYRIVRALKNFFARDGKERLDEIGRSIAYEVLTREYDIFKYDLAKGQVQKYYKETLATDPVGASISKAHQDEGIVLTGSLALRNVGSVYRTDKDNLHDLDFIVPFAKNTTEANEQVHKKILAVRTVPKDSPKEVYIARNEKTQKLVEQLDWFKAMKEKYPDFTFIRGFYGFGETESYTYTGVIHGEFYEEYGEHIEIQKDGSELIVEHEPGDWVENTGYVIDYFVRIEPDQFEHPNNFALWKEIMVAKLSMAREKDFIDWKNFVPFTKSLDKYNFYHPEWIHRTYRSPQQLNAQRAEEKTVYDGSVIDISDLPKNLQRVAKKGLDNNNLKCK